MHFKSLAYVLLGQSALVAAQSPTTTSKATATCEPHEDHWHCPAGVPQPSLNPDGSVNPKAGGGDNDHDHDHSHDNDHDHDTSATATAAATGTSTGAASTECTPHGDHWHCPSGVPKPTTPPPGYTATSKSTGSASAGSSSAGSSTPTSSPTTGSGARVGSLGLAVVVGGSLLVGAFML